MQKYFIKPRGRRIANMSNYDLWLQECERKNSELHLLERYDDMKNSVKLFKLVNKYEFKFNFYNDIVYCLWDNDKMRVILNYQTALSAYRNVTDKYIQKGDHKDE